MSQFAEVWDAIMEREASFSPDLFCRAVSLLPSVNGVEAAISIATCIAHHVSAKGKPLDVDLRAVHDLLGQLSKELYLPTEMDKIASRASDERTAEVAGVLLCIALGAPDIGAHASASGALSAAHLLLGTEGKSPCDDLPVFCLMVCTSPLSAKLTEGTLEILQAEAPSSSGDYLANPRSALSGAKKGGTSLLSLPFPSVPGDYLGAGMSAVITRGCLPNGRDVAIKKPSHSDVYLKEVALLSSLSHPNVIEICGLDIIGRGFCMPFQEGGTLRDVVYAGGLTHVRYRLYITDLFRGLSYVHSMGIMHGDLKMDNLLIDDKDTLKLADFGHAIGGMFCPKLLPNKYISPLHRPYELLIAGDDPDTLVRYGTEVDVWSCGIIILEMTDSEGMRARLRTLGSVQTYIAELLEDRLENVTRDMDRDIALVTRQCLSIPACRATARQCLAGIRR